MALNENNNKRQYTKYKRHQNDSHERINAETVNSLQKDVNKTQYENTEIKDKAFEERVYTIFENDKFTNAMFLDYFKTGEYINETDSNNIIVTDETRQLTNKNNKKNARFVSKTIYSAYKNDKAELNDFFLITSEQLPVGSSIKYYLELENGERWNIKPNEIKLPLHLKKDITCGFSIVADLISNGIDEAPVINGYAILYWDSKVEEAYGLTNPDLMRFP